jgi:hypothetical protein
MTGRGKGKAKKPYHERPIVYNRYAQAIRTRAKFRAKEGRKEEHYSKRPRLPGRHPYSQHTTAHKRNVCFETKNGKVKFKAHYTRNGACK